MCYIYSINYNYIFEKPIRRIVYLMNRKAPASLNGLAQPSNQVEKGGSLSEAVNLSVRTYLYLSTN